jgi:protein-S-isoprenylcysteine O-methyltransferase Ste14
VRLGTPAPVAPPTRLVVAGQYRHVRNPMYVATLVIVIGQGLVLWSAALLGYAVLLWVLFHLFVVFYEEPALGTRFGASYDAYRRNVRRWWPRIRPWAARTAVYRATVTR